MIGDTLARQKIPTPEQVFGAFNDLFERVLRQPPRQALQQDPILLAVRLGHEAPGSLTSLRLRGEAAEAYWKLEAMLWAATHWGRRGNERRLHQLLQRFLIEMATDLGPGRAAIKHKYITELRKQLGENVRQWKIVSRVAAHLSGHDDVRLVGVRFRSMTEEQQDHLRRHFRRALGANKQHANDMADEFKHLIGQDVTCEVDVEARDATLAFITAQELMTDRLELLAGIAALLRKPDDRENDPLRRAGPWIAIEIGAGSGRAHFGGLDSNQVDLTTVVEAMNLPAVRRLLRLVEKKAPTEGERRLLNALRWSGRSRRADNEITAYLYAVIAYETILGSRSAIGISYGLRLRCAHLLGTNRVKRREILQNVKDLYDKRSAIVHAGVAGIDLSELIGAWSLLNSVILAFIKRGLHRRTDAEIDEWFEDQIL